MMIRNVIYPVLFLVSTFFSLVGQNPATSMQGRFEPQELLFSAPAAASQDEALRSLPVDSVFAVRLNRSLADTLRQQPRAIALTIPWTKTTSRTLLLQPVKLLADDFQVRTADGRTIATPGTAFYRGYVQGDTSRRAALSIVDGQVRCLVTGQGETLIIGQGQEVRRRDEYWVGFERAMPRQEVAWECLTTPDMQIGKQRKPPADLRSTGQPQDVYEFTVGFECDFALYENQGSDAEAVVGYVLDLMNEVNLAYEPAAIRLYVGAIVVWTEPDPFQSLSTRNILNDLLNDPRSFGTDLVHFLSGRYMGGIAYVNSACSSLFNIAVSGSQGGTPSQLPNTSFTLNVVAHEFGHNFGAFHTHACFWTADDVQIDDCGNVWAEGTDGVNPEGDDCFDPDNPIIPGQGTIMSYCHLVGNSELNFQFHPTVLDFFGAQLPGFSCASTTGEVENTSCASAWPLDTTGAGTYFSKGPTTGSGCYACTEFDAGGTHAVWYSFTPPFDGTISVSSCLKGVDTRLWVYEAVDGCNALNLLVSSDNDCQATAGGDTLAAAVLNIPVEADVTYYLEWDDRWSDSAFSFDFNYEVIIEPIPNPTCATAIPITATGTYNSEGPKNGNGCYACIEFDADATHASWYSFTAPEAGTVSINSCLQGVDTRLWVYRSGSGCTDLTLIGDSDDDCLLAEGSTFWASQVLNIPVEAGVTYYLEWDDRWSKAGFSFDFVFEPSALDCGATIIDDLPNPLPSGEYRAKNEVITQTTIEAGSNVTIGAGQQIRLQPGFTAASGSTVHLIIESCPDNPPSAQRALTSSSGQRFPSRRLDTLEQRGESSQVHAGFSGASFRASKALQIEAFPNPFGSAIRLRISSDDPFLEGELLRVGVFTLTGQPLGWQEWHPGATSRFEQSLQLSQIPAGTYVIKVISSQGFETLRVQKMQ